MCSIRSSRRLPHADPSPIIQIGMPRRIGVADACFTFDWQRTRQSTRIPSANLLTTSETSRNSFGTHDLKEGKMLEELLCRSVIGPRSWY